MGVDNRCAIIIENAVGDAEPANDVISDEISHSKPLARSRGTDSTHLV